MQPESSETFCGQAVSKNQLSEIVEIVDTFSKLSRSELANTICELFSWKRPSGKLKTVECRQFLERLDARGIIQLPSCRNQHRKLTKTAVPRTTQKTYVFTSRPYMNQSLFTLGQIMRKNVVFWGVLGTGHVAG